MLRRPKQLAIPNLHRWWNTHPPLFVSAALTGALALFFLAGIFLDPRYIGGAPVWLKPLKFAVSFSLYSFTLLWMLGFVEGWVRLKKLVGSIVVLTLAAELLVIAGQAARGLASHFNVATPLDAALWSLMGVTIVVLWMAHLAIAWLVIRQRFASPPLAWSLRLGLVITLIGMTLGFLMTMPSAQQLASWQAGAPVSVVGAHSVGVQDAGPGLPLVGWSTQGGDLRVGHFIGMHALQVLPFLAWLMMRRRGFDPVQQTRLIWIAAGLYLGLTLLVTWQALRAQPITAPDAMTALTLLALLVTAGLATFIALRRLPATSLTSARSSAR